MERRELPEAFAIKMQELLGDEWERFLSVYKKEHVQALRFNPLKKGMTEEAAARILGRLGAGGGDFARVPWAKQAFYYDDSIRPGKHPYHEAGLYYIQEPSAMSAAALLAPQPGMRVLDLCAAPGGKTAQLAAFLDQNGLLVANEIHPARCRILSQNVERMGICNAIVTNEDSKTLAERFPLYFHAILVDAPCSGEGMFRKHPEAMEEWSGRQVLSCAQRQREILENAAVMLMAGGTLVYSTCTFSPEENERTIARFLAEHREFEMEEREAPWFLPGRPEWVQDTKHARREAAEAGEAWETEGCAKELKKAFRLWPQHLRGEGHFAAVLRKKGALPEERIGQEADRRNRGAKKSGARQRGEAGGSLDVDGQKALADFCRNTLKEESADWILSGRLTPFGGQLYRLPSQTPSLKGLRVLRAGLQIGELKKNRLEPSHALALALGRGDVRSAVGFSLADSRTNAYFLGETVTVRESDFLSETSAEKGWTLVCIDGFSAGWGKLAGNQLKNHYPKGLRRTF